MWVLILLVLSMIFVSALGATFSIIGMGVLFSGATLLVWMMAAGLEIAKFAIAAFLHQAWPRLNVLLKSYLLVAVIILSVITSMGIFGFLSDAYELSTTVLEEETIKLESLKNQLARNEQEIARINKAIDEVPASRISKKMKLRAEAEPAILEINKRSEEITAELTKANLHVLAVKKKVGPLIYIVRAFNISLDLAVKYLILLIVTVFDPLAICLVLAVSESFRIRRNPVYVAPAQKDALQVLKMRFAKNDQAA